MTDNQQPDPGRLAELERDHGKFMTPGEVAAVFRVDRKTVTRWSDAGLLPSLRTPGNQRRYREADIRALVNGTGQ